MLPLRQIRRRIRSTENTKKMTRAMEMVAAAKLKKLQELLKQSDLYIGELRRILETLVREKPLAHPLLEKRQESKATLAFLITSDTGLCGSYNTNILDLAGQFLTPHLYPSPAAAEGGKEVGVHFIAIGRQGAAFLKRAKQTLSREFVIPRPQEIDQAIREIAETAKNEFRNGQADRVLFLYTKAESLGSLKPTVAQLFPIISQETEMREEKLVDYLIEPNLDQILEIMLPEFIEAEVGQLIKHSLVAEQASRMMAMRQATENAKEMIDSLTLLRNKARQASITKELIEVVSGARALQVK